MKMKQTTYTKTNFYCGKCGVITSLSYANCMKCGTVLEQWVNNTIPVLVVITMQFLEQITDAKNVKPGSIGQMNLKQEDFYDLIGMSRVTFSIQYVGYLKKIMNIPHKNQPKYV